MFEFEVQTPPHVRLRIGRLHFRTWRSHIMVLPKWHRSPELIYAVELYDEAEERSCGQIGAFFSQEEAEACRAQLVSEGRTNVVINMIAVYARVRDWQFDR